MEPTTRRNTPPSNTVKKDEGGLWETIKVIIQALLIAVVVRTVLFQPFNIPSGSLIPTLLIGDYLFVSKYSYGYSKHSIPFSPPLFNGPHLRLAAEARRHRGLQAAEGQLDRLHQARHRPAGRPHPGDRRRAPHQRQAVQRERVEDYKTTDPTAATVAVPRYKETFPERHHRITSSSATATGAIGTTPRSIRSQPGHFFMMGDNRDNSTDLPRRGECRRGALRELRRPGRDHLLLHRREFVLMASWEWPTDIRWNRMFERDP